MGKPAIRRLVDTVKKKRGKGKKGIFDKVGCERVCIISSFKDRYKLILVYLWFVTIAHGEDIGLIFKISYFIA